MEIRNLKKTDLEAIEFIKNRLAQWWLMTPQEVENEYITTSFRGGFPYIFIALDEKQSLLGKIFLVKEEKGFLGIRNQPWIQALFVKEQFRGQGIARQLIRIAEVKCKELGFKNLYLDTGDATGYYKRLGGWVELGEDIWEKGLEKVTIMMKELT